MRRIAARLCDRGTTYWQRHPWAWLGGLLVLAICLQIAWPETALAGPGGLFVKAVFKTFWGKLLFAVVCFVFLPLIAYVLWRQAFEVRRCKRDLAALARELPMFAWAPLEAHVRTAVGAFYRAWRRGDLAQAAEYVMPGFLESQRDLLDRWNEEGKVNAFELHGSIQRVAPLHVRVETEDSLSVVAVLVCANVTDFLAEISTGKVIKGNTEPEETESVIYFAYSDGAWRIASIEEGSQSLVVATMKNELDASYLLGMAGTGSQLSGFDPAQHPGAAKSEGGALRVAEDDEDDRGQRDVAQR
jgi:hypothetical protein